MVSERSRHAGVGAALALAALLATGCGDDDPLSYSAPVGINLKAKSGDVKSGSITDEKGITTESGNPYGAFVRDARARLGADPARIDLGSIQLLLGGSSKGVTALDEVFSGQVEVLFVMDETKNSHPAGSFTDPSGGGAVDGLASFDSAGLNAVDWTKLLAGSFKVTLRGPAAASFATKSADADLQVTLVFRAFQ